MLVERVARGNTNIANSLHSNNNPQEENIDVLPASIRIPRLAQIFSKICAERIEYTLAIANRRKSKYRRAVRYSSEPS